MSILIKGMEIPTSCSRCFCMASCRLWKNIMHPEFNRHRNCPLVPVPPHGRLGDLDALAESVTTPGIFSPVVSSEVLAFLRNAPTIVPAEEDEA